jgi:hypothetical protein
LSRMSVDAEFTADDLHEIGDFCRLD